MAASITIKDESLIVDIEGADRLWALKSRLRIPLAHVTGAWRAESIAIGLRDERYSRLVIESDDQMNQISEAAHLISGN